MDKDLKSEIDHIVEALKDSKKDKLARQIEENWDKTCLEYSKNLNSYKTPHPLENIMKRALGSELERLGYSKIQIKGIAGYLKNHRTIQTTPHIAPAEKP